MARRISVFLDYQNVYHRARDAFSTDSAPARMGQVDPLALGRLLVGRVPCGRLVSVRVYRGRPSQRRDPKSYAAYQRQTALQISRGQGLVTVIARFDDAGPGALAVSTVVLAELLYGAARHAEAAAIRREIGDLASRLDVVPWGEAAAEHYGDIRAALERRGTPLGAMDMMIAAHARSRGATLVSNDTRHFERVEGLLTANWA